ncbi:MAG: LemA family protein, partial [Mariniphaga sp.]
MKNVIVIIVFVLSGMFLTGCGYNKMVDMEEQVTSQWSQVENVYQRRADLIPNLVNTVREYASHEQETFVEVVEARSKATSVNVDAD